MYLKAVYNFPLRGEKILTRARKGKTSPRGVRRVSCSVLSVKSRKKRVVPLVREEYFKTFVPGFDKLLEKGIPQGNSVIVAGGAGCGKTLFCLQTLVNHAKRNRKCLYISFEEPVDKLKKHLREFGWDPESLEKCGVLQIIRKETSLFASNVEAMLAKARGELLLDLNEILEIIPKGFMPEVVVIDSITAIGAAFPQKSTNYRIFLEQLFRYLESLNVTSFLISETQQMPKVYSPLGVEEFLADGVVVLYNVKKGDIRENAIEILKMRGAKHLKRVVPMRISQKAIEVFPNESAFTNHEELKR